MLSYRGPLRLRQRHKYTAGKQIVGLRLWYRGTEAQRSG